MIRQEYFKKKNQGYALLLAILLTSTILISASALARVTLLSLRQGQNIDRAAAAFYAASSGVEKGLFLARRAGQNLIGQSIEENIGEAQLTITAKEDGETNFKIKENDFVVLDLPANHTISELRISPWINETSCPPDNAEGKTSWLEVSVAEWNSADGFKQNFRLPYTVNDYKNDDLKIISLPSGLTQVRLKSLYCDINQLTIQGVSDGEIGPLPSRLAIKAVGTYRGVKQALQAMILEKTPLSGFFDFVLFSEDLLVK